jgi:hypothetical protein
MASRQKRLAKVLFENQFGVYYPFMIDKGTLINNNPYHELITNVYKSLGGIQNMYPLNFGDFDISIENCFIELDEEHHFNRYRRLTLDAPIYKNLKYFPVELYNDYCVKFENKVGKTGSFWSTPSSDKQFGPSRIDNEFPGNGPTRWKQRAFYDFLKDIISILQPKPVYRFSIYESLGYEKISLNKILLKEKHLDLLVAHLRSRMSLFQN